MPRKKTNVPPPPPLPYPSNDLPPPKDDNSIQHFVDKERREVWVYLPQSFETTPEYAALLGQNQQYGRRYWGIMIIHVSASEQIRKNDSENPNSHFDEIIKATTSGLNAGIGYISDLARRPPFDGEKVFDCSLKLWQWKTILTHGKVVKAYLGCGPYSNSNWRKTPALRGTYYCDLNHAKHFIEDSSRWNLLIFTQNDVAAGLVLIEEDTEGTLA
ncbi:hypothetical protein V498_07680 [Pseudogymnoascus sp. VKM F-4517 (FW-2822)]|nr:hypothetical protein V498_07680 [Pseudogymnoascus sp. VKM F-4517 (FW-2822)]